jgi:hypothetical protein
MDTRHWLQEHVLKDSIYQGQHNEKRNLLTRLVEGTVTMKRLGGTANSE